VKRIVFAGGGTAGHIEPALAVARQWRSSHPDSQITFIGTTKGLETRLVPKAGFTLALITKVKVARSLSPSLVLLPFTFIRSVAQALSILHGADLLVGFGGYVSGPAYLAAALRRIPIVIHEANAHPGIANRFGARFTSHLAVAYEVQSGKLSEALLAGLPLKQDIAAAYTTASKDWLTARHQAKSKLGFEPHAPLIFIFGGSQGSVAINKVIEASRTELLNKGIQVLHGVGVQNELPQSAQHYKAFSYISDMSTAYLAADVIISRSGAVTCSEVNTLGKYALFIPLPVGNGEQQLNADSLIKESRAEIIEQKSFTSHWLVANVDRLLEKASLAPIAGSHRDMDAASKIVGLMEFAMMESESNGGI
jgi:UDP-N-acetylglucosamine--N-acetylmuramyl-(pentapeptide) pyrophosphoryl-undecaprenol N-acetylglucosamine transferase